MKKKLLILLTTFLLVVGYVMPVFASTVTVDFKTDKNDYTPSATISVTGTVLKDGAAGKGTKPLLKLINPSGKTIQAYQWLDNEIGTDGTINTAIKISKTAENGIYAIQITAGGVTLNKSITITGNTPTGTLDVATDKSEYKPNDLVHITGKVLIDNQPTDRTVNLKIENNNSVLVQDDVQSKSGDFAYDYQIRSNAATGTYKITATIAGMNVTISKEFTVKMISPTPTDPVPPGPTPPPLPDPAGPVAPEVDAVTSESTVITGKSEVGTTVTITDKSQLTLSAITDSSGTFAINLTKKIKEGTTLYAIATNSSGKSSKETIVVVQAKIVPAPVINEVKDFDKVITGKTEPGATVFVYAGTKLIATKVADRDGKFSISIPVQRAGTTLLITVKNLSGSVSLATKVVVKDKTAPKAPIVKEVRDSDKNITGRAEKGSKVVIKVGSKIIAQGTSDVKGNFSIVITKQKANTILVTTATDKAGNISGVTKTKVKDKTPPGVPGVNAITATSKTITGKAEPGATVFVKIDKKVYWYAIANSKGYYTIKIKNQKNGTSLLIYAKDKAGNTGKSRIVKVKK